MSNEDTERYLAFVTFVEGTIKASDDPTTAAIKIANASKAAFITALDRRNEAHSVALDQHFLRMQAAWDRNGAALERLGDVLERIEKKLTGP